MTRYLVVRSWVVNAESEEEAIERAAPGEHQDVRAMLTQASVPSIRVTFSTRKKVPE